MSNASYLLYFLWYIFLVFRQFRTDDDNNQPTFSRPHANSNVSDDENAYTHHTAALTQLTEGDDDDHHYATQTTAGSDAVSEDQEVDSKDGSDDKDEEGNTRPNRFKPKSGKGKGGRGGKGSGGRSGGRDFQRGGRGRGRGRHRGGPPALPHDKSSSKNDIEGMNDKVTKPAKKFQNDKDTKGSSDSVFFEKSTPEFANTETENKEKTQSTDADETRPSGGRGRGRSGGRGGRGRGRGKGGGGRGRDKPSRGPPATPD